MSVKDDILTVGFNKNGQADFGVRCIVANLSYKQMTELRAMIAVAIGTMEQMWRDEQQRKNPAAQSERPDTGVAKMKRKMTNKELADQLYSIAVCELRNRPTAQEQLREAAHRLSKHVPFTNAARTLKEKK